MRADTEGVSTKSATFDKAQAKTAVKALLNFTSKKKADSLFLDAPKRFLLDIQTFKTPAGIHKFYNVVLPNSPFPDASDSLDILLVVEDKKDKEPEHIVGEVKDQLMDSKKSNQIKVRQIMTFKQLKDDFATFEAKKALAKSVDVVIAEKEIFKMLPRILGRQFYKKKKTALQIPGRKFQGKDLGEQIWYALQKSVLNISMKGQTSTMVIGHDNLNADELAENVSKIANWLQKKFPGGWKNIQKLSIHTGDSGIPPLVVYFSTGNPNDVVKAPVTRGGSIPDAVGGEISTQPGSHIRVHATGEIEVFEMKHLPDEEKELLQHLQQQREKYRKNRKQKVELEVKKEEVKEEATDDEDDMDNDEGDEEEAMENEEEEKEDMAEEEEDDSSEDDEDDE